MAGEVVAVSGEVVAVAARSLCLHGDTPGAAAMAVAVRRALDRRRGAGRPVRVRIRPVGAAALLVELDDLGQVEALHAELVRRRADGRLPPVDEIVPAARTVLLDGAGRPGCDSPPSWPRWRCRLGRRRPAGPWSRSAAVYDGEDLPWVAERWGMSVDGRSPSTAGPSCRAAFCGFAPGFAYLVGLPERCHLPAAAPPRPRVPAGAVAVAGEFTGVYPRPSPGGWHLIGRTDAVLWDPHASRAGPAGPGYRGALRRRRSGDG